MVDVQTTTKSQVLNRETLDAIPTGRTIQGMGQLITGVSLNQPDIGGSKAMQQTYMSAHGAGSSQTTVQVDGLMVNGIDVDGAVQNYFNSSMSQEMVYTTSGASADVAGGGVRLNMIPRDGGNQISGSVFLGYQDKSFQSDNVTDDLRRPWPEDHRRHRQAVQHRRRGRRSDQQGQGLVLRLGARLHPRHAAGEYLLRHSGTATPNSAPLPSNEQGVDPQSIRSIQARLTWQMSPKNKLSVYNDRLLKNRGSAMTAGYDPATAGIVWNSPIYSTGSVKFTSTATSKILVEAGFSTNYERYNTIYQEGLAKTPFSPEWYTVINKQDSGRGTDGTRAAPTPGMYPDRFAAMRLGFVRDRCAQRQGRHPGHLGPLPPVPQRQRRPAGVLQQRSGVPVQILNTPAELRGRPQGRPRHLRTGLVDASTA